MTPEEFAFLRDMFKQRSGLIVTEEKRYLVESRLMPVAREIGLDSLSALISALRNPSGEPLRKKATEAMTINESFFFRDKTPFENFAEIVIPALCKARATSRRLRIWCAAASTGQEPYSLAIQIKELRATLAGWNVEIVGTDISGEVLEKAKAGLYSQFEVQRGLPIQMLVKYFQQTGAMWQIDSSLRAMVRYQQMNLLEPYRALGTFDIIFCRNVLIYFDAPTKSDILTRLGAQLQPDGFLVLGAAETVIGLTEEFAPLPEARGLYTKTSAQQQAQPPVANLDGQPSVAPLSIPPLAAAAGGAG